MNLHDFRIAIRVLGRELGRSLLAIFGLGVGLAVAMLLLTYVRYSWGYNTHIPNVHEVYVVKQRPNLAAAPRWEDVAPLVLRNAAKFTPGVTSASGYVGWFPLTVQLDGKPHRLNSLTALPDFDELFGLQAIRGDLREALSRPDAIALTERAAVRLFGTSDVLGRTLQLSTVHQGVSTARVAAILADPPTNTTIPFEALNGVHLSLVPEELRIEALTGGQFGWEGNLFVRLQPGASIEGVTAALQQAIDRAPTAQRISPEAKTRLGESKVLDVQLAPVRAAYFDRDVWEGKFSLRVERGNRAVVGALGLIALLVLATAAINYVNLATLQVVRRQREIGMRKVVGAGRAQLVRQFLTESLVVAMLATAVGVVLMWLALPLFAELMKRDLGTGLTVENLLTALAMGLVLGALTALYPAYIAARVQPARILSGRLDAELLGSKQVLKALAIFQTAAASALACLSVGVYVQTKFAMESSPGFDPAALLVVELPVAHPVGDSDLARGFVTALSQHASVAGVAVSNDAVGRKNNPWNTALKREGGPSVTMDIKSVSANFFEVYALEPISGRLFESSLDQENDAEPLVLNEIAARKLGYQTPQSALGQTVLFRSAEQDDLIPKRVVGIAPEVRYQSLRETADAVAYELFLPYGLTLTVRARNASSTAEAERAVRELWPRYFPNAVLDMTPAADVYAANYAEDTRLTTLLALSTLIALSLGAFGAYVVAADAVQRRTKEIAVRKVFGAEPHRIAALVTHDIVVTLLWSIALSVPITLIALGAYLSAFAERAPGVTWATPLGVVATAVVVALATAQQTWKAVKLRPAVALRC